MLIKACGNALMDHPQVNTRFTDTVFIQFKNANIGFAVATPEGLITPIIRAVNMGNSAFIRSDGSVQGKGLASTLASQAKDRRAAAGFLIDRVYLDSRITLYSKIGDSFSIGCTFITALLLIIVLAIRIYLH